MPLDWTPFVELVGRHQRFLIMTHVRPDGDALGSQLGLASALRQLGKQVRVVIASNLGPRYEFLNPDGKTIERFTLPGDTYRDTEVIIIIDTGTWNQLGDFAEFMKTMNVPKVVIDHHRTQDDLGALRLVDTSAEAAGRLAYDATVALGATVTKEAAQALFMALATDTGWFRHSSTSPETLVLAESLMRCGANPTKIYDSLFEQSSLGRLRLIGRALDRLRVLAEGRIAYTEIYVSDYAETGAIPPDTEDLISYPRSVTGVEVAFILIEQPRGGVKASFRSRDRVDVDRVAEQFNGGGHRLAAGATLSQNMAEARQLVVAAVEAAVHDVFSK